MRLSERCCCWDLCSAPRREYGFEYRFTRPVSPPFSVATGPFSVATGPFSARGEEVGEWELGLLGSWEGLRTRLLEGNRAAVGVGARFRASRRGWKLVGW